MATDLEKILSRITLWTSKNSDQDLVNHSGSVIDLAKITPPRLHLCRRGSPTKDPSYQVCCFRPGHPQNRDSPFPSRGRDRSDGVIQRHTLIFRTRSQR